MSSSHRVRGAEGTVRGDMTPFTREKQDDAKVATYLQENLGDFDAFLSAVDQAMRE